MDMRKLVGRNVRRLRLEKGLTQETLSERSGFTQQYFSKLERGLRNPTILSLYEFALALGVDHVALVSPDDEAREEDAQRLEGKTRRLAQRRVKTQEPKAAKRERDTKKRIRANKKS